jgi:peptidylamidoglycolate lyase
MSARQFFPAAPGRKAPSAMRRLATDICRGRAIALLAALFLLAPTANAASPATHSYQLDAHWARLPEGTGWQAMSGVAIDSKGNIYALQRGDPSQVMVFDPNGKFLYAWGDGAFMVPHGLRVDDHDNVWITDLGFHQVFKFNNRGRLLMVLGTKGIAGNNDSRDALNGPSDMVVASNGDIFVSDGESSNARIVHFSSSGRLIKFWGTKGAGPAELDVPHSIVMDRQKRLYVANRSNKRIEIFSRSGAYLGQISNGDTPYGLFMAKNGILYVVDGTQGSEHLTVLDTRDNKLLARVDGLVGAHMVAVDRGGNVYVSEVRGRSVKKFLRR